MSHNNNVNIYQQPPQQQIVTNEIISEPFCCCSSMRSRVGVYVIAGLVLALAITGIILGAIVFGILGITTGILSILFAILGIVGAHQENFGMVVSFGVWLVIYAILAFISAVIAIIAIVTNFSVSIMIVLIFNAFILTILIYFAYVVLNYATYLHKRPNRHLNNVTQQPPQQPMVQSQPTLVTV